MHSLNKRFGIVAVGLVAAIMLLAPPVAKADLWDLSTTFSINQPFMVPGKTLEANTNYIMRILDTHGIRKVISVFNADGSQLQSMFIAISAEQLRGPDKPQFTFMETDPGFPKPIQKWFYPGRNIGFEFLYPEDQALNIAAHQGGRSLVTRTAAVTTEPSPTPVATNEEPAAINAPSDEVFIAQNEPPVLKTEPEVVREKPAEEPVTQAQPEDQQQRELPRTAGELPVLALVGALSMGLGLAVRFSVR